jgi:peptide/nickel transport system substrate-binding protein
MKEKERVHRGIKELKNDFDKGKISRREFIRYSVLLGMSLAAARQMVFAGGRQEPAVSPAAAPAKAEIKRGGIVKAACAVLKVGHPAQLSWNAHDLFYMQIASYLTTTDVKNITHPYLLKNWQVSDDLKTWTLNLKEGITFNNGDEFTADDVIFTYNEWLNKDVGSAMLGLVGSYLEPTGIEKASKYQVKLHLTRPEIAVPEHLFQFPALILDHKTFEGDFLKAPHGTGPFTLELYREGEIARMRRREDFWMKGVDGKTLPYVDGVEFIDMGTEYPAQIAALKSGDIHIMNMSDGAPAATIYQAVKDDPNVVTVGFPTARVKVMRMRADVKPYDDNRVRLALKLCQNREKMLKLAHYGEGVLGHDTHVSPAHPDFCEQPLPKYDPQRARQLLQEAGYTNGLDIKIAVIADQTDAVRRAEVLKEDSLPAGFRITIDAMPGSKYWEKWTEVDLGITQWAHRPLGTMVLGLGYVGDADGKPVAWNETRWVDREFDELFKQASGTYDVKKRKAIMCKLEAIQMERGSIGIPYWENFWSLHNSKFRDVLPTPIDVWYFDSSWLEA